MANLGIYIHVPFCESKCGYCDFYSAPAQEGQREAYTDAVIRFLKALPFSADTADTVYFGGGTPTLLDSEQLIRILDAVNDRYPLTKDAEITLEANPARDLKQPLTKLHKAGFNRLSMGAQSFDDSCLSTLGRRHNSEQIPLAVLDARQAGFENISLDLMLGIPNQNLDSLDRAIDGCVALDIPHLSAYLLKIEPGTPFDCPSIRKQCADDEVQSDFYLHLINRLTEAGYQQYEISNFAKNGLVSRHNVKYWRCEEYLGIGPAAHSYFDGKRFFLPRDLNSFLTGCDFPERLFVADGTGGDFEEKLMLGLRLAHGINLPALCRDYGRQIDPLMVKLNPLIDHRLVNWDGTTLSLTPNGMLLSNQIIGSLLT